MWWPSSTIAHLLTPLLDLVGVPHGVTHAISFVVALALATYLHMLFGEMLPKNVALSEPVRTALLLGPPLVTLTRALRPVIFAINAFANALLRLLRVEVKDEVGATFSDDELARMVKDSSDAGLLDDRASERLHDALELGRRPVTDVVLPHGPGGSGPRGHHAYSGWSACRPSPGTPGSR